MENSNDTLDTTPGPIAGPSLPQVTRAQAAGGSERGDYWTRTCGVPWERISKAVQAVGQRNLRMSARAPRDGAA